MYLETGDRRRMIVTVAQSVAIAIGCLFVYFIAPLDADRGARGGVRAALALTLLVIVIVGQTLAVLRSETPRLRLIQALAIMVSLVLTVAAASYLAISASTPTAFTERLDHVDALYLLMMTMTTIGFGVIGAVSTLARVAVMIQMAFNFIALGVAAKVMLGRVQNTALVERS
ncbi:MAG: ion channel [Ilumatobacter sp.]